MKTIGLGLLFLVFLALGVAILAQGIRDLQRARAAQFWPSVEAQLERVELRESRPKKSKKHQDSPTYELEVEYRYRVAGRDYVGTEIAFGYSGSRSRKSEEVLYQKLAQASRLLARYDPSDPSQACLTWGLLRSQFTPIVFGTVWLVFVLGCIVMLFLSSRADASLAERLTILQ